MKAIIQTQYGPPEVLTLSEIPNPLPGDGDVLIKVVAVSVGFGDIYARNFKSVSPSEFSMPFLFWMLAKVSFGINKPKKQILGAEFSGKVESVGKKTTRFKVGDAVFGYLGANFGANAEYICFPEKGCLALKPSNLNFQEAAAIPYGALMALGLLKQVKIQPGQKILINGASGGIGSAAVQLARNYYGAKVTGVCSTRNLELVKLLGAENVIDYTQTDYTQNGETYDLIFDIPGKSSFSRSKGSLTPNGTLLLASFKTRHLLQMLMTKMAGTKKIKCALAIEQVHHLEFIRQLIEEGKYKAFVDKNFPLEQAAAAHRYVESGLKKGSVVLTVSNDE
jgi:NADPH:quinone reductase-like Zn-dependent oxidoreductase